jgi:S1-C subfamily serine protease
MKRYKPLIFVTLIVMLVSISCQFGMNAITRQQNTNQGSFDVNSATQVSPSVPTNPAAIPTDLEYQDQLLTNLFERSEPGVVAIGVLSAQGGALGSGFVYDKQGHIITNYHVIENATDVEVDFPTGEKVRGEVIGVDTDSDIAVIKVNIAPDKLFPLPLGDSNALKVGQTVVAIGNPFGYASSMTVGIVSARGRTLDSIRTTADGRRFSAGGIIQTDAAINPGNSGGPLLNLKGEVIGIARAIYTTVISPDQEAQNSGVGFAIPVNIVKRVVPELIGNGSYDYPYLGMTSSSQISLFTQEALELPQSTGAYVQSVVPGGPAEKAGLRGGSKPTNYPDLFSGGDLIIAVDGRPVRVFGDLLGYMMETKSPGDTMTFTIIRDGEQKEVVVTLGKRP